MLVLYVSVSVSVSVIVSVVESKKLKKLYGLTFFKCCDDGQSGLVLNL